MSLMSRVLHGSSGSVGDVGGETALFRSIDSLLLCAGSSVSFGDTLCMHCAEQEPLNSRSIGRPSNSRVNIGSKGKYGNGLSASRNLLGAANKMARWPNEGTSAISAQRISWNFCGEYMVSSIKYARVLGVARYWFYSLGCFFDEVLFG